MVQSSGKVGIKIGSISCSLPILTLIAATLAVFLGFIIIPWLGLPLRSTIQSYIWSAGFGDLGKNAEFVSTRDNLTNDNISPALSPGNIDSKVLHNEGISNQSEAELKQKKQNEDMNQENPIKPFTPGDSPSTSTNFSSQSTDKQVLSNGTQTALEYPGDLQDKSASTDQTSAKGNRTEIMPLPPSVVSESGTATIFRPAKNPGKCDLYQGKWVHDSLGPLYKNDSCPVLSQPQNCQGNGRPDKDYENWRWQPMSCDLPRFDAHKFLELMHGKTLAFVGDSVCRNQMESMMCILWQVETPQNKGNKKMQRWFFRSHSVTIIRIWSSWLVHTSNEAFQFAPEGLTKLHLDKVDETFMDYLPQFDVVVISSGHWFAKKTAFLLNDTVVGGQLWWVEGYKRKIDNVEAFSIATETALKGIVNHPNYKGITILRSYSPDHYEGGAWNTGGSCTGKVRPFTDKEIVTNGFTNLMWSHQNHACEEAKKRVKNSSKLIFMDITSVFQYRGDGHPGPYRSPDPNKKTQRGPNGNPPPQDCLHWCMPGPVDTWNELVFEIVRRNLNGIDA
ncbi:hypothetical protein KI387_002337 [Taxus chinensis]|uniref:Trichome birefringence-like N-terminal domain-containing protein n=1 Tax=Taxus chinensis TaxID=29808 RepID=A0AA38LNI2_TAXCH|nr:hypothetical protein KI387_002337 [Taxus chinensis]